MTGTPRTSRGYSLFLYNDTVASSMDLKNLFKRKSKSTNASSGCCSCGSGDKGSSADDSGDEKD